MPAAMQLLLSLGDLPDWACGLALGRYVWSKGSDCMAGAVAAAVSGAVVHTAACDR
jgi:hypothetical protein